MTLCFWWPYIEPKGIRGRVAQLEERRPYKPEVTGSSPVPPTMKLNNTLRGCSSDWLERWPVKPEVAGSSPVNPAIFLLATAIHHLTDTLLLVVYIIAFAR